MSRRANEKERQRMRMVPRRCPRCEKLKRARNFHTRSLPGDACIECQDKRRRGLLTMGELRTKRAIVLCDNPRFGLYLDHRVREKHGMTIEQMPNGTHTTQDAHDFIKRACQLGPGEHVDMPKAERMFERIFADFSAWLRTPEGNAA